MTQFFGMVKENFPEIPTFTTAYLPQNPQLLEKLNVDWMCPLTSKYSLEDAEKCREAGRQVWSYICCGPDYPYANIMFRFPLIESRILGWQAFEQKYDGLLYWGVNIWSAGDNRPIDPNDGLFHRWTTDWRSGGRQIYGDGRLLYPHVDRKPIGSLRLANLRDGLEDYEYLHELGEKMGDMDKARQLCPPVFSTPTSFTRDAKEVERQRERLVQKWLSE